MGIQFVQMLPGSQLDCVTKSLGVYEGGLNLHIAKKHKENNLLHGFILSFYSVTRKQMWM